MRFRNIIHELARDRVVLLSTHIVSDVETIAGQIMLIQIIACSRIRVRRRSAASWEVAYSRFRLLRKIGPTYRVLGECERGGVAMRRVAALGASDGARDGLPSGAVPVEPTLEDAFLVRYAEGR